MSKLIIVSYDNEYKAEEMRLKFLRMQKEYVVSIEDAVVVVKNREGKVKLHQMINLPVLPAGGSGACSLAFSFCIPCLALPWARRPARCPARFPMSALTTRS